MLSSKTGFESLTEGEASPNIRQNCEHFQVQPYQNGVSTEIFTVQVPPNAIEITITKQLVNDSSSSISSQQHDVNQSQSCVIIRECDHVETIYRGQSPSWS